MAGWESCCFLTITPGKLGYKKAKVSKYTSSTEQMAVEVLDVEPASKSVLLHLRGHMYGMLGVLGLLDHYDTTGGLNG